MVVKAASPRPVPCTVTSADSEIFDVSYDIATKSVTTLSPTVAISLSVVETPAGILLEIDVRDAQFVLSEAGSKSL